MFPISMRRAAYLVGMFLMPLLANAAGEVEYVKARAAKLDGSLVFTGSVTSPLHATLSPQVPAQVLTVAVDAGDKVSDGQTLLRLDDRLARLGLAREQAALDESRTRLKEALRLRDEAERLARDGNLPKSQYETLRAEAELARAERVRLEAQRAEQAERVRRHLVVAPFSGWIARRTVAPGEWVVPGDPILELVSSDGLRIDLQLPQRHFQLAELETEVVVQFEAVEGESFAARVRARVPAADPDSRSFLVRVVLDQADSRILPGMSARVRFAAPSEQGLARVPAHALVRFPDGSAMVWIVDPDDRAQRVPVEHREVRGGEALVRGLNPEQRVVVKGSDSLKPGIKVRAIESSVP